ncbi:DBR1-domain-containing protein [Massarina eburnea CBS 473.64]|uniref:DBR1-domain-containing protein n=1 Tax=Massarina eburnea CBS 473.64 TaxID=1395130 RepID=A0A6A6RP92_9PLEO|nr:DBR1-domain-containing protein [Massarina eburnea CBS 473.64]
MAALKLSIQSGLRIAVEGCGHGTLHEIYASVKKSCELKGWPGVDLLIIGGDFQAVRNALDLKAIAMPTKYYAMHDFHEYYSGKRIAPYLTTFIGGNHEASNYLWELYYGGWVAPNIYYMGAANVVRLGPLRIAGLSGIWKGYSFKKPHHERLPYNGDDVRSIYHVRELDTRKLLQVRSQVDVGLSHDWPRGVEWKGNHQQLFRFKPYFKDEAVDGTLGSVAAAQVLERLRPRYWFSAHMHAKYAAIWEHANSPAESTSQTGDDTPAAATVVNNNDEIDLDMDDTAPIQPPKNDDEIDLDMDDDAEPVKPTSQVAVGAKVDGDAPGVPEDIRALLPKSFSRPAVEEKKPALPFPSEITNKATEFLALDKCLPNRHFLQLLEIAPHKPDEFVRPLRLQYDPEWLAITRVFANDLTVGDPHAQVPADKGDAVYRPLIEKEMEWVEENVVKAGKMTIPEDFAQTAPLYDPTAGIHVDGTPQEYSNPHTQSFCDLLQIANVFHASDSERAQMMEKGARPDSERTDRGGRGGKRGGRGGLGGGRLLYTPMSPIMTSKFQEILEPAEAPAYTHPHLNVSLEDILREGRERSASESSSSSSSHSRSSSEGTGCPKSPTPTSHSADDRASVFRRRAFTLGSKKGRRVS